MKDISIKAVLLGVLATIIKDISDFIYMSLGFKGTLMAQVAAGTFLNPENLNSFLALIIGYTAHFTVGGILGLIFLFYVKITGSDYNFIKGIFFGLTVYLFLPGILINLGVSNYAPMDISSKMMLLIDHLVFGIFLGYFFPIFVFGEKRYSIKQLKFITNPVFKKVIIENNKNKK